MSIQSQERKDSVLIVDDVAKNIQLVANILTKAGYQISFALDGNMAIEHASKESFDLILLDIMMPGIDGYEVCQKLKENSATAEIPIIFLTARTDDESIAKGFELGGVDYITKPFNPRELLARVRTHIRLRQREMELKSLNHTKDTFLSIIGHDLKTPVANIVSIGDILIQGDIELGWAEKKELLNDVTESGRQAIWLLENLLSWTRIQTGKISNNPEKIVLKSLIERNVGFILPYSTRKNIDIKTECSEDIILNADLNILNTILRNLLSNAVKFTRLDGSIMVHGDKTDMKTVKLYVSDNGVGIEKNRIHKLFKLIGQSSTFGTQNEKGSGLGLVLVKDLADIIGASIEVESTEGQGTKFTLTFAIQDYFKK